MSALPTVYFIDDSATMREVIKIAFRRENMEVVASHDAAAALDEIEQKHPDVVITDVIMPGKDGYEVCQFIKNHPELSRTPVILMSGVVNRAVAERAFAVKADELLRKPFQPQDLIARVRHLLNGSPAPTSPSASGANAAAALSAIFSPLTEAPAKRGVAQVIAPGASAAPWLIGDSAPDLITDTAQVFAPAASGTHAPAAAKFVNGANTTKLRLQLLRLEGLTKKLQAELSAEREYSKALEEHIKTLQESE
jgi:CheY-like chemotaxis protein